MDDYHKTGDATNLSVFLKVYQIHQLNTTNTLKSKTHKSNMNLAVLH